MTKSNDVQQRILNALSMQGDISVLELSRLLRQKAHLIQYQLNKLLAHGHIRRTFIIDHRTLGLQTCNLLFNLPAEHEKAALKFLERQTSIAWIFRNLGERELEISANIKSVSELAEMMKGLGEAAGTRLHDHSFAFDDDMVCWGYRYAMPDYQNIRPIYLRKPQLFDADELDLKILRASRASHNATPSSLGRDLGASASTVRYRLDALEQAKVISNTRYFLGQISGNVMQAQVRLSVQLRTPQKEKEIIEACQHLPQATSLTTCVGDWDYKIVLHAQSLDSLMEAQDSLRISLGDNLYSSHFSLRREWLKSSAGV